MLLHALHFQWAPSTSTSHYCCFTMRFIWSHLTFANLTERSKVIFTKDAPLCPNGLHFHFEHILLPNAVSLKFS